MIFQKIFSLILLVFGCYTISLGQIQYKIALINGKDLYQVSLISEQDFVYPGNIVGTAQISIKAPVSGFELGTVSSLMENVEWENNALIASPREAESFQYFSFGLANTGVIFPLEKGLELPLFTFINTKGSCPGDLYLVDNQEDSFLPPNSRNANIGNQITPFACTNLQNKNAYSGNVNGGIAGCGQLTSLETIDDKLVFNIALSPNPALHWLHLQINTNNISEEMVLQIWEVGGKLIKQEIISPPFANRIEKQFNISAFSSGSYAISLWQGNKTRVKHFIKTLK